MIMIHGRKELKKKRRIKRDEEMYMGQVNMEGKSINRYKDRCRYLVRSMDAKRDKYSQSEVGR